MMYLCKHVFVTCVTAVFLYKFINICIGYFLSDLPDPLSTLHLALYPWKRIGLSFLGFRLDLTNGDLHQETGGRDESEE